MKLEPDKLRKLIEDSGLSYKKTSASYIFNCPRCNKKDKLYIRKRDGRFCCWVCREVDGFQGRPEFALTELLGQSLADVRVALYGDMAVEASVSLDLGMLDFFGNDEEIEELPQEVFWPYDYYPIDDPKSKRGAEYLAGRGVPIGIANEYGIRYCPANRRVAFPVYDEGRLLGWQERLVIADRQWSEEHGRYFGSPKILSSKDIPRDRTLMFGDRLRNSEHAVLCEGPIDALKAHLVGGNVCSMGKAISKRQIGILQNSGIKKLYLALDPDAAQETSRIIKEFSNTDIGLYLLQPPKGCKDIGDMEMDQVVELFRNAPKVNSSILLVHLAF